MIQQSLVLTGKQLLEWKKVDLEELKPDEISIRTIAGAISIGAELPQYCESDVTDADPVYPRETGYESYGEVIGTGSDVTDIKTGDRVLAFYGHKTAGIVKAAKAVKVPISLDYQYALLNTLSCDAGKGVLKLHPEHNEKVLVTGAGTIGLLTVHFLKNHMKVEQVDVLEPNGERRRMASVFGASKTYSASEQVPSSFYEYGLECSASSEAFQAHLRAMKPNAEICILSDGNRDLFYLNENFYEKELRITGSSDGLDYRKHAEWFFAECRKAPYLSRIFDYQITSDELIDCFERLSKKAINPIKVLVKYS
ncbi:alcohol dehydrogenase [Bacillus salacetis]|uniref:Alcohol dehydrogenase n=1 Tax=Bacillus salacetis TaxID=2315464 RepID=A0A3A1QZV4_9BACI|nr:zinc-binding alcohol dehydrogenase [Bacillus salacetis]RIW31985.1 alcohol dehydrogenase [Bacillus salacetis]